MLLENAIVCTEEFTKKPWTVETNAEKISFTGLRESSTKPTPSIDLTGYTLLPGFIDMHIHGCKGADTCDASISALETMSRFLGEQGVTSFCPTTMTIPMLELEHVLKICDTFRRTNAPGARMLGVHLEGPFLSPEKSGVQRKDCLRVPDISYIHHLEATFPNLICIIDVAPELPGAMSFISEASKHYLVSASHTIANYDTAKTAIEHGLSHATHLFNAMSILHHHDPGVPGAILDSKKATAEVICDGVHIHPAVLRLIFHTLGMQRTVIISDAMRAAGMPDGDYTLGGQPIIVKNRVTSFADGRLAGSTTNIREEIMTLLEAGIPWNQVIASATINPARCLGMDNEIGSIQKGKYADMVALDDKFSVKMVMSHGRIIYSALPEGRMRNLS